MNELREDGGKLIDANYDWQQIKGPTSTLTQIGQVWQPIDTAQKDGSLMLLWARDFGGGQFRYTIGRWLDVDGILTCNGDTFTGWTSIESEMDGYEESYSVSVKIMPSHWMPLPPEPPK
jgi:hypothetical protein